MTIDPQAVMESGIANPLQLSGVTKTLPGTLKDDFEQMAQPYGIYVNPYTGYIYGTDAGSFEGAGYLYQWTPEGQLLGKHKVYINPGHFLALPPDGHFSGIVSCVSPLTSHPSLLYDLLGRQITKPQRGNVYLSQGRKFLFK